MNFVNFAVLVLGPAVVYIVIINTLITRQLSNLVASEGSVATATEVHKCSTGGTESHSLTFEVKREKLSSGYFRFLHKH